MHGVTAYPGGTESRRHQHAGNIRAIGRVVLVWCLCLAGITAGRALIVPSGAVPGCCCGACLAALPPPPTFAERLTSALAQVDDTDRSMRALPQHDRFLPAMATERDTILRQAENARQLLPTVQPVTTLETAVSAVEVAARHYAAWPLRAQILSAAAARQQTAPDWGLLSGSEFSHTTEYLLPAYAEPHLALNGLRGEQVSTQLLLLPFDQALSFPAAGTAAPGILLDPLVDEAGHALASTQWTLMTVLPWWCCLDGNAAGGMSAGSGMEWSDLLHPLARDEQLTVPLGTVGTLRCRLAIPSDLPPGVYHGAIHLAPAKLAAQTIPVTLTVWPASVAPAWRLPVEVGTDHTVPTSLPAQVLREIAGTYHLTIESDCAVTPRAGWYHATEPGSLSLNASLIMVRLLPWEAWAKNAAGITIPMLYRWRWTTLPTTRVDGQIQPSSLPPCPGTIDDLAYPGGPSGMLQPSIRLETLRDGVDDVACLRQLADALRQGTVPAADRRAAADVLDQARRLARMSAAPEATARFRQLRQRLAELLGHLPSSPPAPSTKETAWSFNSKIC